MITAEVIDRRDADNVLSSRIIVQADRITQEVTRASTAEGQLSGRITVQADQINAEVTRATAAENSLSGRVTVNANKVAVVVEEKQGQYVVKAASIVAGINDQTGSYVKIEADTINLSGYVTATQFNAQKARFDNLVSGDTTATWLKAVNSNISALTIGNDLTFKTKSVYWQGVTINGTSYHFMGYVG
jgi:hypothetical protein